MPAVEPVQVFNCSCYIGKYSHVRGMGVDTLICGTELKKAYGK